MVGETHCRDESANYVRSSMGSLKAMQVVLGKSFSPDHALPTVFGAWLYVQRSLAQISQKGHIQELPILDSDFLSQFCRVPTMEFLALNRWYDRFNKGDPCPVPRKFIKRHMAVLRKMILSMKLLNDANTVSRGIACFLRQPHRRFIVITMLVLMAAAGGTIWANGPSSDQGIHASYFKDDNFKNCYRSRIDENVDYDWKTLSPMKGIPKDHFSVIWDGWVIIKNGELKRFIAGADDTIRVYVDGILAIVNDGPHRYKEVKSEKLYGPGRHRLKVMFREHRGGARARLRWNTNNGYWSTVPASRLRPRWR